MKKIFTSRIATQVEAWCAFLILGCTGLAMAQTHVTSLKNMAAVLSQPTAVAVSGNTAYVVSSGSLEILSVANGEPVHIGYILNSDGAYLTGANAVALQGNYAYISSEDDNALEIIDVTPDPVDWIITGFGTQTSNMQTITGLSAAVTLKLNKFAVAAVSYSLNGGAWTAVPSGATGVSISVANGDQLQFRKSGCSGGSATITNSSDADTLIDTITFGDNCP